MHIPLKVTTDYTLLKSLIKIPDLISFLREKNITACGICDENLYGVLDFYFSCKKNNIKYHPDDEDVITFDFWSN